MERYKYRGRKLTAIIARPLIYELFKGKEGVARAEITQACEKEHRKRGGIESEHPSRAVKVGLDHLRMMGIVEDAGFGFWHINDGFTLEDVLQPISKFKQSTNNRQSQPKTKKHIKHSLFGKQEGRCAVCNRSVDIRDLTFDHIKPLSKGGEDNESNLQLLCTPCNSSKGSKTQSE